MAALREGPGWRQAEEDSSESTEQPEQPQFRVVVGEVKLSNHYEKLQFAKEGKEHFTQESVFDDLCMYPINLFLCFGKNVNCNVFVSVWTIT